MLYYVWMFLIAAVYMIAFDVGLFCKSNDLIESVLQGNETTFCVIIGMSFNHYNNILFPLNSRICYNVQSGANHCMGTHLYSVSVLEHCISI